MILWNDSPVSFQTTVNGKSFTQKNGQLWNGGNVYYTNFPFNLTMKGTKDISTSRLNTLYLPSETSVLRITFDDSNSISGWMFVVKGRFLNGYSRVFIHQRLVAAGSYIIDNTNALYLFNTTDENTILTKTEKGTY